VLPPDEPPGTRLRSHGLRVGKKAEFSVEEPIANSSMLALPMVMAPIRRQTLGHVRVVGRDEVFQHLRRTRGAHTARADKVFERNGHAAQRANILALRQAVVEQVGTTERFFGQDGDKRLDLPFDIVDALQKLIDHFAARHLFVLDLL
jgi:hypothetical protein